MHGSQVNIVHGCVRAWVQHVQWVLFVVMGKCPMLHPNCNVLWVKLRAWVTSKYRAWVYIQTATPKIKLRAWVTSKYRAWVYIQTITPKIKLHGCVTSAWVHVTCMGVTRAMGVFVHGSQVNIVHGCVRAWV